MSTPFIIWTFQRSGGTSLSAALRSQMAGRPLLQEPFNPSRKFGDITRLARLGRSTACRKRLNEVLAAGTCFKHCFELHPRRLNSLLAGLLNEHPHYRHLLLVRQDEVGRICSRFLALQTSVWGKRRVEEGAYDEILAGRKQLKAFDTRKMLAHMQAGLDERQWLDQALEAAGAPHATVYFESVFAGQECDRLAEMERIHRFLDVPFDPHNPTLHDKIFFNKQGSEKLFALIPNYDEARNALECALLDRSRSHSLT